MNSFKELEMATSQAVQSYISKLSPKAGDILVFRCPNDVDGAIKAQAIYSELGKLVINGKINPEVSVLVVYGNDQLDLTSLTDDGLKSIGLQRIPK